jgi:hypothetical protein
MSTAIRLTLYVSFQQAGSGAWDPPSNLAGSIPFCCQRRHLFSKAGGELDDFRGSTRADRVVVLRVS